LGEILARPLIELLKNQDWIIDLIVPVPLGVARLKERGYNQSALLTRPIALAQGISHRPRALTRTRETRSQVGLTFYERRENVAGAFLADSWLVKDCHALVVDDVATSSATLDACAVALIEAGAQKVYGLTLARAGRKDN
jgi:predicted amidophosphoribosyltransferase